MKRSKQKVHEAASFNNMELENLRKLNKELVQSHAQQELQVNEYRNNYFSLIKENNNLLLQLQWYKKNFELIHAFIQDLNLCMNNIVSQKTCPDFKSMESSSDGNNTSTHLQTQAVKPMISGHVIDNPVINVNRVSPEELHRMAQRVRNGEANLTPDNALVVDNRYITRRTRNLEVRSVHPEAVITQDVLDGHVIPSEDVLPEESTNEGSAHSEDATMENVDEIETSQHRSLHPIAEEPDFEEEVSILPSNNLNNASLSQNGIRSENNTIISSNNTSNSSGGRTEVSENVPSGLFARRLHRIKKGTSPLLTSNQAYDSSGGVGSPFMPAGATSTPIPNVSVNRTRNVLNITDRPEHRITACSVVLNKIETSNQTVNSFRNKRCRISNNEGNETSCSGINDTRLNQLQRPSRKTKPNICYKETSLRQKLRRK